MKYNEAQKALITLFLLFTMTTSSAVTRKVYRDLYHHISRLSQSEQVQLYQRTIKVNHIASDAGNESLSQHDMIIHELRTNFRRPLDPGETVDGRIKLAESKLSFWRMTTSNVKPRMSVTNSTSTDSDGRHKWIYKDGKRYEVGKNDDGLATVRDGTGRIISSFDGKNLDPQSVTTHRKLLRRAGFVNNLHAKGIF
jgi:hypothetical protein